ncbi:asparagine synthase (glutamine-hydrolyzing) [Rathayibacter agropyri]
MSAVVAFLGLAQPAQRAEELIDAGLAAQSGRAPGPRMILRGLEAILGTRAHFASGIDHSGASTLAAGASEAHLVVSGFIDNVDELRRAAVTSEDSIAGVLLSLYLERGHSFVDAVGGAFVIIIWDERVRTGYLYRDRLGIEPLYYHVDSHSAEIRASSELKGLLVDRALRRSFDISALPDLLNSTSRVPGTTVFTDFWEVRPGTVVVVKEGRLSERTYWQPPRLLTPPSTDEAAGTVRELLKEATLRRMSPSVEGGGQGFLLSGGLDSSAICSFAAASSVSPIATYSFAYENSESDFASDALHVDRDEPYAEQMARALASDHTSVIVRTEDFEQSLRRTIRARDLPGVGDLDVALLATLDAVGAERSVVFSGEAADDVFGGYPWFASEFLNPSETFPWLRGSSARALLRKSVDVELQLDERLRRRYDTARSESQASLARTGREESMRTVFWSELTRFLPFLLDRIDRMSAAAGVRVRLPFTDHRLIEYAWDLPYSMKTINGLEKGLLRSAVRRDLPQSILARRKSSFAVARGREYREAVLSAAHDLIQRPSIVWDIASRDRVADALRAQEWADGTFSGPPLLPRLIMLDAWCEEYDVTLA